jgi:hypothetical protein
MKRCKICQNRFEPRFSTLERVCWDVECKSSEALQKLRKIKDDEVKFERKRLKQMKSELMTIKQWVIKAQGSFNKYVRLRDEHLGCVSCGAKLVGSKYDAGHFYNANNHWGLRFDEFNVHGQCVRCNRDLHGNLLEYRKRIVQRIGQSELDRLDGEANNTRKFSRDEVIEIYTKYKAKCNLYQKND